MNYLCPVCGYDKMTKPPMGFYICPCCGTEFELDDAAETYTQLRRNWLANGARWFSPATLPPADWNPYVQLLRAGLGYELTTQSVESDRKEIELEVNPYQTEPITFKAQFLAPIIARAEAVV